MGDFPIDSLLKGQAWAIAVCKVLDIDYKKHFVQKVTVSGDADGDVIINVSFLAQVRLLDTLDELEQHVEKAREIRAGNG